MFFASNTFEYHFDPFRVFLDETSEHTRRLHGKRAKEVLQSYAKTPYPFPRDIRRVMGHLKLVLVVPWPMDFFLNCELHFGARVLVSPLRNLKRDGFTRLASLQVCLKAFSAPSHEPWGTGRHQRKILEDAMRVVLGKCFKLLSVLVSVLELDFSTLGDQSRE